MVRYNICMKTFTDRFINIMSKDIVPLIANVGQGGGIGFGAWGFLSNNATEISALCAIVGILVAITFNIISNSHKKKLLELDRKKTLAQEAASKAQQAHSEAMQKQTELEIKKLELEMKLKD